MTDQEKELFVPVTERLPTDRKGYLCITKTGRKVYTYYEVSMKEFDSQEIDPDDEITNWLDLSLLTTKKKAEELAYDSWLESYKRTAEFGVYSENFETFINENKHKL